MNPRKLTQALHRFEIKPSYEDVFQVETSSVDEYLQQLHQAISVTAVQEAQQGTVAAFDDFMDATMQERWRQDRTTLLESVVPFSSAVTAPGPSPGGAMSPYAPSPPLLSGNSTTAYRGTPGAGRKGLAAAGLQLRGRAAKYAAVIGKLVENQAAGRSLTGEFIREFTSACMEEGGLIAGEHRTTMLRVWQVIERVLSAAPGLPKAAVAQREEALLAGAKGYLQDNYHAYMQSVVASHRTQAVLGGSPTQMGLVHAFIRVRERERGVFDFDQAGGIDTTWLRVYTCLRAGFKAEAISIMKQGHGKEGSGTPRAADLAFAQNLQTWSDGGSLPLAGEAGASMAAECERLLRDRSSRQRSPFYAHRVMCHAVIAGASRAADALLKEFPGFFSTIEDFMWFRLSLVRSRTFSASGLSELDNYTILDLVKYLMQYPASHYTHGGKEPMLYVIVLIMSLQFKAALHYLATDPSTREYRLDAVHVGACFFLAGVLEPSSGENSGDAASLLRRYAREFVKTDVDNSLRYYMLAASAAGGSVAVRGAFLRELLVDSKAYGFLLGAGGDGSGGALATFIPDPRERSAVLEAVARECAIAAQYEEAVELFLYAGCPRAALRIINDRLSELAESAATDSAAAMITDALIGRGAAAVAGMGPSPQNSLDVEETKVFNQLKSIKALLKGAAQGDYSTALHSLTELPFIPLEPHRLESCCSLSSTLHPALADRLPAILLAGARALAAAIRRDELQTLINFASSIPLRIPTGVYQKLNQIQATVN